MVDSVGGDRCGSGGCFTGAGQCQTQGQLAIDGILCGNGACFAGGFRAKVPCRFAVYSGDLDYAGTCRVCGYGAGLDNGDEYVIAADLAAANALAGRNLYGDCGMPSCRLPIFCSFEINGKTVKPCLLKASTADRARTTVAVRQQPFRHWPI